MKCRLCRLEGYPLFNDGTCRGEGCELRQAENRIEELEHDMRAIGFMVSLEQAQERARAALAPSTPPPAPLHVFYAPGLDLIFLSTGPEPEYVALGPLEPAPAPACPQCANPDRRGVHECLEPIDEAPPAPECECRRKHPAGEWHAPGCRAYGAPAPGSGECDICGRDHSVETPGCECGHWFPQNAEHHYACPLAPSTPPLVDIEGNPWKGYTVTPHAPPSLRGLSELDAAMGRKPGWKDAPLDCGCSIDMDEHECGLVTKAQAEAIAAGLPDYVPAPEPIELPGGVPGRRMPEEMVRALVDKFCPALAPEHCVEKDKYHLVLGSKCRMVESATPGHEDCCGVRMTGEIDHAPDCPARCTCEAAQYEGDYNYHAPDCPARGIGDYKVNLTPACTCPPFVRTLKYVRPDDHLPGCPARGDK